MSPVLLAISALLAGQARAEPPFPGPTGAWKASECPEATPQALTRWRDGAAGVLSGSIDIPRLQEIAGGIRACFPDEPPGCMRRIYGYATRWDSPPKNAYRSTARPEIQDPPEEFRVPGRPDDFRVPADLEKLARSRGWDFVKFKTRGSAGFDAMTTSLYLFHVPGSSFNPPLDYDRWMQFSLPPDPPAKSKDPVPGGTLVSETDYQAEAKGQAAHPRTFSMITMEKSGGNGPDRPYFQTFERRRTGSPEFTRKKPEGDATCLPCHPSGMRQISPLGYRTRPGEPELPADSRAAVERLNGAMEAYGPIAWRGVSGPLPRHVPRHYARPQALGPPLGPVSPLNSSSRSQAFINGSEGKTGCALREKSLEIYDIAGRAGLKQVFRLSAKPAIRWEKIRNAMDCANCHDGRGSRGELAMGINSNMVRFKVLVDHSMPPGGAEFTDDERIALVNCLFAEQALELPRWLREQACSLGAEPLKPGAVMPKAAAVNERGSLPEGAGVGTAGQEHGAVEAR